MTDRYYVFKNGCKRGPFSLDDLLNETERGRIEYEYFCLRIGSSTCEKVHQALDWEDGHIINSTPSIAAASLEESVVPEPANPAETDEQEVNFSDDDDENIDDCNMPDSDSDSDSEKSLDDYSDAATSLTDFPDDENDHSELPEEHGDYDESALGAAPEPTFQSGPPRDSTTILYCGRPSLLSFPKSLLFVALSLGSAIWFREQFDWILVAGISCALIVYLQAQFRRMRHQYYITPKQVEVIHGLILESSREICIENIGAIHIRQRGLQGLLGLATIEFAAEESPMPILVFRNVRSARRIKSLIRRLQDALE